MENFYINLNQIKSNPDGQTTVNRQSRLMSHQGKALRNVQMSSTCLRSASVLPPFRSRYLRYAAMIFAVLVMSIANIGMAWGDTENGFSPTGTPLTVGTVTVSSGNTVPSSLTIGNIAKTNGWKLDSDYPLVITSTSANITKIIFVGCTNSSSTGSETCGDIKTSSDGSSYTQITSGVTIKDADGSDQTTGVGFSMVKNQVTTPTTVTVTFSSAQRYVQICKAASNGKQMNIKSITVYTAASSCTSYSFHYGNDGAPAAEWTTECFVAKGDDHEMQIEGFTIPSTTHFYVGKNGSFSGTSGNASDANSVTSLWSAMYFATSIGDGTGTRPMVGQATGATGTIRIYDNSTWNNKQAAFIPDGYKLKVGSTEYAMAVHDGNEYRSDIVEMSSSNARSNISVGITNGSGGYVATDNTQEMQHLFLNTGGTSLWSTGNASNFAIYDDTDGHKYFTCLMTKVPGEDYLYEGWVPSSCTKVIFCRMASTTLEWGAGNSNVWNLVNTDLEANKNLFTISGWDAGTWSAYEKKGKFRMNADWKDKNWYVRFVPYHILHYDANGGSGAPADASVASDAVPCQWTLSTTQPTWADHVFLGWSTNSSATAADDNAEVADLGNPYTASGNVTLYAVWQACSGPTINSFTPSGKTDGSYEVGTTLGSITVEATAGNDGTLSYQWYQYDGGAIGSAVVAAGTSTNATYNIPNNAACVARHYYCVVSEEGCSTTRQSDSSGALTLTEPVDPCAEPAKLTNEIARFFVPCGTGQIKYEVTNANASTNDNTFTTVKLGSTEADGWYVNPTSGLRYAKLTSNDSYIQIKLKSGNFQAGDVVTAYFNRNNATKTGLTLKTQGSSYAITPANTAAGVETSGSYTLVADAIESDGSIKLFRANSSSYVNRIIVTREPACFEITDAKKPGSGWTDRTSSAQEITSSMLKGTISGGTVLYSGTGTLGANETYGLVFDNNNDEITITLSGTTLPAGALIVIGARGRDNTNSHQCGFVVSGNSMSPATTTSSTSGNSFTQTYTVKASDGIIGGNTFTIKRVTDKDKTYLESLYIIGCEEASCADFTVVRGGQESGTFTVGSYGGSALTCTPSPAGSYTYAWKQYPTAGGTPETAVSAEGTGNNTNSFTPNPASAGTYIYFCDVTDACSTTKRTSLTGAFTFNAAPAFTASTSVNIEQGVLTNSKKWDYQSALTAANITSDLTTCELDSLNDACDKTDRNNDYLGLKIKAGAKYIQMNVPSGKTLKVRFGKRAAAVNVWIDGVAQTDIPATGKYYTYELASSGSNRVVKIATADGNAVVIKQIMIGEEIASVTLPAKITLGGTTNGTISVASTKVNVGSTVTVTATPTSGYELSTLTYTKACPDASAPVNIDKTTKQFTMPEGNVTINATFAAACSAPTTAFANGSYTIGGSALDLSTLISSNNSSGAITYTVKYANGTGATIVGTSFSATVAGTATVTATQAANGGYCEKVMDATITVSAAGPSGDCDMYFWFNAAADATTAGVTNNEGSFFGSLPSSSANTVSGSITIDGTTYNVTQRTSNTTPSITFTVPSGKTGKLYAIVNGSSNRSVILKQGSTTIQSITWENSCAGHDFDAVPAGTYTITSSGNMGWCMLAVKECDALSPCTTPVIPALSNQTVCPGSDIAAWNATQTAVLADGETASYSWKKKGNDTEIEDEATLDLGAATESMAGTYVVTVTVSKAGKSSTTANKEVTLTVTPATETLSITASKAKVYATDEVTLTATCGSTGVTWNWYLCANSDGTGAGSSLGTSATYTIASAGAAGTYYYKAVATGDGTHSCGTAEYVYTLVVSAANSCDKEFWFAKEGDRPTGAAAATHITGCPSGSSSASYTASVDGTNYTLTGSTGQKTGNVTIVVPAGNTGTLYVVVQGSSSRTITLSKGGVQVGQETPGNSTWGVFTFDDLDAGTYTLVSSGNISWAMMALKLCPTVACTDDTPTAAATNATVCTGGSITITATGYEAGATFQWQKQNASTSVWEDIDGATSDTYTVAPAAAEHAGNYHIVATKECARTSNTVTISVPSAPNFGSTVPASVSVMQTIALSINTVEATDAVKYKWYKSADATWDAGDTEIGTNKELIKAYDSEAIGSPSYYIFCRAQNACGITTSTAIAVNVTAYVEEDCATRGNEGDAEFGFEYSAGQGDYGGAKCWTMSSNSKILVYSAPDGKYFKTAKVTIASSSESKASYNWSTNGGTDYTAVSLTVNSTLTERTIDLSAHNVNAFQIGRNFDSKGSSGGTLYVSKICFEYTDACTATTVTPSATSKTYEMGGAWSNPTFTLSVAGTLTYSSSNEDIASVDDDGTVTFNGEAGTVTITASYAGGTISATDYCASSGSYTITVTCPGGAPKVVQSGTTVGCSSSITLQAKKQDGTAFEDGTYQWFRNGEEIDGATGSSYTATQAGTYTVSRTKDGCTSPSSNSAVVTSTATEPEVERLVPFQYYHVDKEDYSDQMKMRHLFAVKNSGKLDGKSFKMYVSRNGGAATDVTSSNALEVWPNGDGHVDTVMVDLNKLKGKYSENDELVFTCKAIDCESNVSEVYKNTITMRVIGATPTLALICSGSSKAEGTRKTSELTVGGDFLTGYNVADLCQQTGNTSFDANTEWGLYTRLKENYIVTPVNGYAVFNKLNYEPFDILLLTDYPKASKSDAAAAVLDDMADLCDYRPMLSFKAHMVAKTPSKWAAKGFTTSPVVPKNTRTRLNIVCYAHPMFADMKETATHIQMDNDDRSQIVYTMLTGAGFEGSKGLQGFELEAAENFVTIGLTHYNATPADGDPSEGFVTWTPGAGDRMLVTAVERQKNIEARMIMFAVNCGAQSKFTETGRNVVLKCLEYLLDDDPLHVADCSFTFDNGAGNSRDAAKQAEDCPSCTGTKGDGKWSTAANWGPDYVVCPGKDTEVKIAASVEVDMTHAIARSARIVEGGHITIPAGKALEIVGTIRRLDGTEISPTEENDIHIGSSETGNGTLIFNNNSGDTKARVDMYSNAQADIANMSAATSVWQYIGTPHTDVVNARSNYYGSWLYQYSGSGWTVIPNGGPLVAFRGYCITNETAPVVYDMAGTLAATTSQDIAIPAGYTVIANSWVAPIDINAITDDDMEGISDKSIYFFNTGTDADGTAGTGTEAGTYRTTPIHSASYTGDWQIPSMQGFYISTTSAGTLHLDYERHVRPHSARTVVGNPMYAPKRATVESDEPNVLKIFARGSRYQEKLVVLEREDFTRGYDSGWDGEAWGGGTLSPMVYVTGEGREDAVSAIPEFEGTVIAFKAGEDSEYRFEFVYSEDAEPLYLLDTENNTYTQVITGNAYYFTTTDKAAHSRFILTRKAPQIATGTELTSDGEGAKARKLLIEDKMYILLNGMLYDATGKVVK